MGLLFNTLLRALCGSSGGAPDPGPGATDLVTEAGVLMVSEASAQLITE